MAQVSLYVSDSVMDSLRTHSEKEGISLSKYVGNLIECFAHGQHDEWPRGYWDSVYGCLADEESRCFDALTTHPSAQAEVNTTCALDPSLDDTCDWME